MRLAERIEEIRTVKIHGECRVIPLKHIPESSLFVIVIAASRIFINLFNKDKIGSF